MNHFNPYLSEVLASMGPAMSSSAPQPATPPGPIASVPPPAMSNADAPLSAPPALPNPVPPPPVDPLASNGPPASIAAPAGPPPMIAAPDASAPGPVAPPNVDATHPNSEGPNPGEFPLMPVQGGTTPAHEVELRGPTLKAAQETQNQATDQAIKATAVNSVDAAGQEYQRAQQQERDALMRQAEAEKAAAELADEANRRQHDFDQSSKQLASFAWKPDGGYWSNRSVPQKIMSMVGMAIAQFGTPVGGRNPAYDAIMSEIQDEVKNQENQYRGLVDTVGAKQTAFSQAMTKYGNVNAARSLARASALDAVTAQAAQTAALWKGTDAANNAIKLGALATADRTAQIQQGMRFVLPQTLGRLWVDRNGIRYNEDQARALSGTLRGYEQDREKISLNTTGDILKERAKAEAAHKVDAQYGPMGKAGSEKLATEKAASQQELNALSTTIGTAKNDVDAIIAGGSIGDLWQHNPAWVPGATGAIKNANAREAYNIKARLAVGAAYKLSTDSMEPKNLKLLEHYAAPFEVQPTDNKEVALSKMNALQTMLAEGAASKGAERPSLSKEAEADLTLHGGK